MSKIDWEHLRTYSTEKLIALERQVEEDIANEYETRKKQIEEKRARKRKKAKRRQVISSK
ncbi:MAG TPA: hypothetical protein EYP85_10380 [Armatimonadetes bacterium]|nr:hypothetical protein [Armatimonadota bacterium]